MNKVNIIKKILFAVLVIICVGAFAKNTAYAEGGIEISTLFYEDAGDNDYLYCNAWINYNPDITALVFQVIDPEGKTVFIKTSTSDRPYVTWSGINLKAGEYTMVVSDFSGKNGSYEKKFEVADKLSCEMNLKGASDVTAMMYFHIPQEYSRINIDGLEFDLAKVTQYEANGVTFSREENTRDYRFSKVVPAKNFDDKINVWLYEEDETENIGGVPRYSYSVRDYLCERLNEELPDYGVCKALNDYGYAAQTYFDYKAPATPVTIADVGDLSAYKSVISGSCPGIEYVGSSLILGGTVTIRHYFKGDPEGLEASITCDDVADYKLKFIKEGNMCYVEIRNILATKLDMPYNLAVWQSSVSGNNIGFRLGNYSALTYCEKAINSSSSNPKLVNLAKALVQYSNACKDYR